MAYIERDRSRALSWFRLVECIAAAIVVGILLLGINTSSTGYRGSKARMDIVLIVFLVPSLIGIWKFGMQLRNFSRTFENEQPGIESCQEAGPKGEKTGAVRLTATLWFATLLLFAWPYLFPAGNISKIWPQHLHKPVVVIVVLLMLACIPLLQRIKSDLARKMIQLWLVTFAVSAAPHPFWGHVVDPIVHQPIFLIIAPLGAACIPLFIRSNH